MLPNTLPFPLHPAPHPAPVPHPRWITALQANGSAPTRLPYPAPKTVRKGHQDWVKTRCLKIKHENNDSVKTVWSPAPGTVKPAATGTSPCLRGPVAAKPCVIRKPKCCKSFISTIAVLQIALATWGCGPRVSHHREPVSVAHQAEGGLLLQYRLILSHSSCRLGHGGPSLHFGLGTASPALIGKLLSTREVIPALIAILFGVAAISAPRLYHLHLVCVPLALPSVLLLLLLFSN